MAERRNEIAADRAMDRAREVPRSRPFEARARGVSRAGITVVIAVALPLAGAAPAAAAPDPGEPVIVRLEPGSDPEAAARDAAARGARIRFVYRSVFPGYAAVLPPGGLRGIEGGPDVVAVDPDEPVRVRTQKTGPRKAADAPWGLDRVDQRALPLSKTYTPPASRAGAGVTAYVIDSGIADGHSDLRGRVRSGFTAIDDGRGTKDCAGHGTHVAGTIGGAAYGVAPAVALVAVRTLGCDGSGETSGVIAGIDWAARDHRAGPAVANLSLAGPASESVDVAIRGLIDDGVTVTVAAGNEDENACDSSPAREPAALTVTASDRDDRRASFSNHGPCVDLFAPGVDIVSDWHTGATATEELSGTSMASPHAAGAAALLLGDAPGSTPAQVARRLVDGATTGAVRGRRDTADRLLYVGSATGTDEPRTTPAPVIVRLSSAGSGVGGSGRSATG
jgi:subtilisin family serine protease